VTVAEIVDLSTERTDIEGLVVVDLKRATDERGTVREFYRASAYEHADFSPLGPWAQVNITETSHGGVRGMHGEAMDKLVGVVSGSAFGAYVDARPGSASYGRVVTVDLVPGRQVLVPNGVCNGFQVTSDEPAQYLYCFDQEWVPGMVGVACTPLDPALGIDWPVPIDPTDRSQISQKDLDAPVFAELERAAR
jgi:dTDP-4-dehydrorhamnose 3,5-epimerase